MLSILFPFLYFFSLFTANSAASSRLLTTASPPSAKYSHSPEFLLYIPPLQNAKKAWITLLSDFKHPRNQCGSQQNEEALYSIRRRSDKLSLSIENHGNDAVVEIPLLPLKIFDSEFVYTGKYENSDDINSHFLLVDKNIILSHPGDILPLIFSKWKLFLESHSKSFAAPLYRFSPSSSSS
eukprot:Sdes_comp18864_c0_seq1m9295